MSCSFSSAEVEKDRLELRPSKPLKVALLGDSRYGSAFKNVLELIRREKADLVLHLGDLAYDEGNRKAPQKWDRLISKKLGESYPYLFLIGNHDRKHWYQDSALNYSEILKRRISLNPEIKCFGEEPGVKSYCSYRNFFFILSGIGTLGKGHEEFIEKALKGAKSYPWKLCAWHKNQHDMQLGDKSSEIGWKAYKLCQDYGAFIGTGHEHSYGRTKNLKNIGKKSKQHGYFGDPNSLVLAPGKTFVFVNGLAGASLRLFNCDKKKNQWWANIYTNNYRVQEGRLLKDGCESSFLSEERLSPSKDYNYGVLFITFGDKGDPNLASAEFKTVDDIVVDRFEIRNQN